MIYIYVLLKHVSIIIILGCLDNLIYHYILYMTALSITLYYFRLLQLTVINFLLSFQLILNNCCYYSVYREQFNFKLKRLFGIKSIIKKKKNV